MIRFFYSHSFRPYNFLFRKILHISAVAQIVRSVSFVGAFFQLIPKRIQVGFDCRKFFDIYRRNAFFFDSVVCINQPQIREIVGVAFDVSAAKNRSYKFVSFCAFFFGLAFGEDFFAFCSRNNERIVEPGFYPIINRNIPILEGRSRGFNFAFNALFDGREDDPAIGIFKAAFAFVSANKNTPLA